MDPLSIVAGVTSIVASTLHIAKELYDFIDAARNAPSHINALARDIEGFYLVLGSLSSLLRDLESRRLDPNVLRVFDSLRGPLNDCFVAFRELELKMNKYTKPTTDGHMYGARKWAAFRWQFTEKDANAWRSHLVSYKLTVNVAIATANLANSSETIQATETLDQHVSAMRTQLDEMKREETDADGADSMVAENGSQTTDRLFTFNRFLETTESVVSSSPASSRLASPTPYSVYRESEPAWSDRPTRYNIPEYQTYRNPWTEDPQPLDRTFYTYEAAPSKGRGSR